MWRDMESLGERLNESVGLTSAQAQLNKKRELEVVVVLLKERLLLRPHFELILFRWHA